ncbi:FAD-binding molybdopterin dehydrogenase [Pedobacter yulinensis]|uniref:FAD-binding molybdopterin dehydrogenase n=1 Tax=Pedobacter yulinensis TaxID=2126353 RepID=A0A2T3HKW8_9SPHI|nr:xanthine dehydrogenase family protein subunit M [Pedobacter yulinensis]PST83031.1 FAD-binding molybdopterin dehydrogenase [Pedobacter yulinensis]
MINFQYLRAGSTEKALALLAKDKNASFIAGGTNLVDLMKKGVSSPDKLIDINKLPLKDISLEEGHIHIGALASNAAVADHALIREKLPLLSMALNKGASAQLRNMATVGGNLMQRTRCGYFYDITMPCNKRKPGSGCGALEGYNRMHAIFGHSENCIAVHPSDMCVALAALDAVVVIGQPNGERRIALSEFHRLPGKTPQLDNNLKANEIILGVEVPLNTYGRHVQYLKVRDRSSYAFALVSVAAALELDGNRIREVRLALGGVAHKPWRLTATEAFLRGREFDPALIREAANRSVAEARAFKHNKFKITLAAESIVQALSEASQQS